MDVAEPQLITGPPEQLEQALAVAVGEAQADDPLTPVAVLLGGTLQRPYLQRRVAELNGGIANVRFMMPSQLAMELGEPALAVAGRRPLPPLADRILLRSIAGTTPGYFGEVRDTPGLATALARTVRELRGAGYEASALEAVLAGSCEVADKETALARMYAEFLERRSEHFGIDDAMLTANPERAPWRALFIFGLWHALPALGALIGELAKRVPTAAFLPMTGIADVDDAHAELRATLAAAGFKECPLDPSPAQSTTLAAVRTNLFRPAGEPQTTDGTVSMLSGPDPTHEVRAVARRCLAWAKEGIGFHEMAIAYRHANPYRAVIESVMIEAGIPVYLHEGTPLAERPLGRRVLALLDLTESDYERRAVMDFLSDGRLPDATRERHERPSISRWDRFSRKAGVVRGLEQWQRRLAAHQAELAGSEREYERADAEHVTQLIAFMRDLDDALTGHPGTAAWSEHLAHFTTLLETYVEDPEDVLNALRSLTRFDALGERTTFERFRETVRSTIENLRKEEIEGGQSGAFGIRGVNVLDVTNLRHVRFRAVAIVGVAERSFPAPPSPDPILLDHERETINAKDPVRKVPLRVRAADPEPLQFALAVAAARERLVVSYARKGTADSRPQLPSRFFRELAQAITGERVRAQEVDRLPAALYERVSGSRVGAGELGVALSLDEYDRTLIESDSDLGRAALSRAEPRIARGHDAWRSRFSPELTEFDGLLGPAAREALAGVFDPADTSPSTLESYITCPQRVFMGNVVRARSEDEPEEVVTLTALARGNILHRIYERFLSEEAAPGEQLLHGPGEEARLMAIAEEEFAHAEDRGETGYPAAWSAMQAELREDLREWLVRERADEDFGRFPEGAYEVSFGRRHEESAGDRGLSQEEPLAITAGETELRISGRIDRLNWDAEKTRFRIVDYKTGGSGRAPKPGSLGGADALQLPIYLLAAARLLEIEAARGGAEYHYSTRGGQFKRVAFTGENLAERRGDLEHVLASIVTGMHGGVFHLAPKDLGACRFCDFNRLCPTGRMKLKDRKKGSPAAKAHNELREVE